MPGMSVCGKRCSVASDDFFFVGVFDAIFFLPWLGVIPVVYAEFLQNRFECVNNPNLILLDVSLPGLCVLFFLNWCVALLLIIFSSRGTVSEPEPRRHVATVIYLKFFVSLLELVWSILGSVILYGDFYCDIYSVRLLIKVVTIVQWLMTVVRIWMIIMFYDCFACTDPNPENIVQKKYFGNTFKRNTFKRWHFRFQTLFLFCTAPSKPKKEAITMASEMMSLLTSDVDLVPSDVLAAIMLYRRKCRSSWKSYKAKIEDSSVVSSLDGTRIEEFPTLDMPPWMNLQLARRYFHIGMGVFGWVWTVYMDLACGCCRVGRRLTCCLPCRGRYDQVLGDNCCGCNLAGLLETSGLVFESVVHVSFVDHVFEVPFFVALDHETRAVVLTSRGTMSGDDVLTDISAGFSAVDEPGCPSGSLCHAGMLRGARDIKRKLEESKILEDIFKNHPDYHLVLTGHSLGASVSSILAFLLRDSYPNLQCFAFAPAPAFNKQALPATRNHILTIMYGNDSVPFLNYYNVQKMIGEFQKCLQECDLPKYKIFLCPKKEKVPEKNDIEAQNGTPQANGNHPAPQDCTLDENYTDALSAPGHPEGLFVGGTIIHVWNTKKGYRLKLCSPGFYKNLKFHPNMIMHHFPQYMEKFLDEMGKDPTVRSTTS